MKNKTLDKFMTTRLEIKKTNVKTVHLPDGTYRLTNTVSSPSDFKP